MLDNIDPRDEHGSSSTDRQVRGGAADQTAGERPMADREVPLDTHARADATVTINQWLDGEVSEAAARRADEPQVEFWNKVNAQAAQRAHMKTPAYLADAIMKAIPDTVPVAASTKATTATTAGNALISLSPLAAASAAAGFTALGVLIGRVMGR